MTRSARSPSRAPSLGGLIREGERRLARARLAYGHGTRNAREEAAWLVRAALEVDPDEGPPTDRRVGAGEARRARALIARRIRTRKPAAYLTREAWLGPHRFYVDERVIVPRSHIAGLLLDGLAPWIVPGARMRRALDLCTGSGCLAVLMALAFPQTKIDASDLSAEALSVACVNVARYGLARRVRLRRSDLFAGLPRRRYDLIVSNPPYVTRAAMRKLPPEYRHEPARALAGGRDGLDLVRRILLQAGAWLSPEGLLVLEVGSGRRRVERAFPRSAFTWAETAGGGDVLIAGRGELPGSRPRFRERP